MADFAKVPSQTTIDVKPFDIHISEEKLQHFKKLLELSPIAPAVFENTSAGRRYGIERKWLEHAKDVWLKDFDWRQYENRINSHPNYKAAVKDTEHNTIEIHFLALFSERPDAIPIAFFHGWPGSNCDFLDILDLLKAKYSPKDLPYHVIVPSLPGYGFSSGPPVETDFGVDMAAGAMHNLMVGLGFDSGYLVQGGDLGSFVSRFLALQYDACRGMHVTMMGMPTLSDSSDDIMADEEGQRALQKASEFMDTAFAFALEQGTRAATLGFALSASPLALLSWMGEKLLAWTDEDPPLQTILEHVTFYWLTDTIPRCFYHNRGMGDPQEKPKVARVSAVSKMAQLKLPYVQKPSGYSMFPQEIVPIPRSWAVKSCNLVSFQQHERGGHFPPFERPGELLEDVEEYVKSAWKATR